VFLSSIVNNAASKSTLAGLLIGPGGAGAGILPQVPTTPPQLVSLPETLLRTLQLQIRRVLFESANGGGGGGTCALPAWLLLQEERKNKDVADGIDDQVCIVFNF
jgi:hypothetical protein